jgi:hypothetical protein
VVRLLGEQGDGPPLRGHDDHGAERDRGPGDPLWTVKALWVTQNPVRSRLVSTARQLRGFGGATIGASHVQNSQSPKPVTTDTAITCQLVWTCG